MKNKSKIALLILAVMLLVSVFAFTGCKNGNDQPIEPPATVYKVHRVRLQFENKTIVAAKHNGCLSARVLLNRSGQL